MEFPDTIAGIYAEVFRENALKRPMFNLKQIRQAFFKSVKRKALVVPENLQFSAAEDEIYNGKKKLILNFILPRGSYGTMFVKRLFSS